jgi:hypothetical protein
VGIVSSNTTRWSSGPCQLPLVVLSTTSLLTKQGPVLAPLFRVVPTTTTSQPGLRASTIVNHTSEIPDVCFPRSSIFIETPRWTTVYSASSIWLNYCYILRTYLTVMAKVRYIYLSNDSKAHTAITPLVQHSHEKRRAVAQSLAQPGDFAAITYTASTTMCEDKLLFFAAQPESVKH